MSELDVTIITGMSGAGRSAAADVLEDLGFFVIDNLPPALIPKVAELARGSDAVVALRARRRRALRRVHRRPRGGARTSCAPSGARTRVLFLDAGDDVLVRRFEATRRRHPLASTDRVSEGIARERALLGELKGQSDLVIDTSNLNVHELRDRLGDAVRRGRRAREPRCRRASCRSATSTASRSTSTSLFDCRFLPNPHWVDSLRPLTRHRRAGARLRARPARGDRVPRRAASGCSRCCCPRTCARARRTCRSASVAPAAVTAAS